MSAPFHRIPFLAGGASPWWMSPAFVAADGAKPCAILDFNQNRYALPAGLAAGDVASATVDQLTRLHATAFNDAFTFTATRVAEAALYRDEAGLLRPISTSDVPRFDRSNGKRQFVLENALTNKVQARKHNPIDLTNIFSTGGGIGTIEVVSRPDLLAAAGLDPLCNNGNVYKLTVTTPPYYIQFGGTTGNTNLHTCDAYIAGDAGVIRGNNASLGTTPNFAASAELIRRTNVITPANTSVSLVIGSDDAAATYYIILPGLYEQSFAPIHPIAGSTTSAVTRAIETARFSPLVEALYQRSALTLRACGQMINDTSNAARVVGYDGTRNLASYQINGTHAAKNSAWNGTTTIRSNAGAANPYGVATAYDNTGTTVSANGTTPVSGAAIPTTRSQVYLGRSQTVDATNPYGDGWYDTHVLYPVAVSSAALQAMAVPA